MILCLRHNCFNNINAALNISNDEIKLIIFTYKFKSDAKDFIDNVILARYNGSF